MDGFRHLLVHVDDSPRVTARLRTAAGLASAHGAALSALYAVASAHAGAHLGAEAAALALRATREHAAQRLAQAHQRVLDAGVACEWAVAAADPLVALQHAGRTTDLLVLGQHEPGQVEGHGAGLLSRLLVSVGVPLLFVPYVAPEQGLGCGRRVLVAWADTPQSARAVRDALPVLQRAEQVDLVQFVAAESAAPETLQAVAAHLQRHGVPGERITCTRRGSREPSFTERMRPGWTPDAPVAESLLSHAADIGADLVVMGGFGHSRAWELVLGGVTRTLLESMTVPVLMSH